MRFRAFETILLTAILYLFWSAYLVGREAGKQSRQCELMHGSMRGGVCYVDITDFPKR